MGMRWNLLFPGMTAEHLGLIPTFLRDDDPRPAREQFNERYAFGGGWHALSGCKLSESGAIIFPGDPPNPPVASTILPMTAEVVSLHRWSFVSIVQADGSFEVARMD